jgi:glycosyltransferase involved in cell wall biosynthesis
MERNQTPGERVAFYLRNLHPGGIQRVVLTLATGLHGRGYTVDIVLVSDEGALRSEVPDGVQVHALGSDRALTSLPDFVRYVRRNEPDVVVSASDSTNLLLPWIKSLGFLDARVFVSVHNNMTQYAQMDGVWYNRALPFLIDKSYPRADGVITVSEGIAEDLREISEALVNHTVVVHNPVVDKTLLAQAQSEANHPWLQENGRPVVLGVGRLVPQKNFPLLVRAFAMLREEMDARLILLGSGPERTRIRSLTKQLSVSEYVSLPGHTDNPYPYFKAASLFVLSSDHEGFGNVIVEAMACGCPVVSTDCPSGPREILEGGRWGRLIPVNDAEALAEAMQETLAEPPDSALLRRRADDFSVSAAVDRYIEILFPVAST